MSKAWEVPLGRALSNKRAISLGVLRGLDDDLESLWVVISDAETPGMYPIDRAVEAITTAVSRNAGEVPLGTIEPPEWFLGPRWSFGAAYSDGRQKARLHVLLYALLALEAQADALRQSWRGTPRQLVTTAIMTAKRALRFPDAYRVRDMYPGHRVTRSDPESFTAVWIVANSTPGINPDAWTFSRDKEIERLSALPPAISRAHRAWLALECDQPGPQDLLEEAAFAYQMENLPSNQQSVGAALAHASEQLRAAWSERAHPISPDIRDVNLFPFAVRSAHDVIRGMVDVGGTARPTDTFPLGWYDEFRPTLQAAIAAIRHDLVALTRANIAWNDAFARWRPIAARLGRTVTIQPRSGRRRRQPRR